MFRGVRATALALLMSLPIMSATATKLTFDDAVPSKDFADDSELEDNGPPTKRIRPLQLAAALRQVADDFEASETPTSPGLLIAPREPQPFDLGDDEADERAESTITVSAEENKRLLARSFSHLAAAPTSEANADDITLDAPISDLLPAMSPLEALEALEMKSHDSSSRDSSSSSASADLDLALALDDMPEAFPELSPILAPALRDDGLPYVSYAPKLDHGAAISGVRLRLTPEMKQAVLEARQETRAVRSDERKTNIIVAAIWMIAIAMITALVFFVRGA